MNLPTHVSLDRRLTFGVLAAAAAGLALPRDASARVIKVRGMVGGGLVHFEPSQANFSLSVSRITVPDENKEMVVGSVLWVDTVASIILASARIDSYVDLSLPVDQGEGRRIRGLMRVNDADEYPFQLDVIDVGLPGSGQDSVNLIVGEGAGSDSAATPAARTGFSYAAAGPVVIGDLQDVDFDLDTATASPISATPTT
jgi:hypothetical protein